MPSGFVFDSAGNLFVNVAVGGGGGSSNVTIAGQSFSPLVVEDLSTNIVGNAATSDATQIGFTDGSGNTRIPSLTTPLPINVGQWDSVAVAAPPDSTGAPAVTSAGPTNTALATWTSATSANTTAAIITNSNHYSTLVLQYVAGTITGGNWVCEGSLDGTNWSAIQGFLNRNSSFIGQNAGNISIGSGTTSAYVFNVAGYPWLRIRLTVVFTGAGSVVWSSALLSESSPIDVTNPQIFSSAVAATTEPITAISAFNALTNSGALVVVQGAITGSVGNNDAAMLRTPAIFKTASVPATASGNTAVWTPAAGKKFRLMRFQITAQNIAATTATLLTISFQDGSTGITIGTYDVLMPAVANLVSGIMQVSAWVDLGNGVLSAAANNVLNANISATVTGATGTFRVNACGTEE
jgi:hypothetical protein